MIDKGKKGIELLGRRRRRKNKRKERIRGRREVGRIREIGIRVNPSFCRAVIEGGAFSSVQAMLCWVKLPRQLISDVAVINCDEGRNFK
jgi:hypothetical protein